MFSNLAIMTLLVDNPRTAGKCQGFANHSSLYPYHFRDIRLTARTFDLGLGRPGWIVVFGRYDEVRVAGFVFSMLPSSSDLVLGQVVAGGMFFSRGPGSTPPLGKPPGKDGWILRE